MPTVYLNGHFLPQEDACIPVTDRGFLFGDGVYEVIPAYGGRLFRLSHHLQRLQNSLDGIRLGNPMTDTEWEQMLEQLLEHNREAAGDTNDQAVYLHVTRGSAAKRDHGFPETVTPTVYAISTPIPATDPAIKANGLAAITLQDFRWQHCDIKAVTLLANVLLRQQAIDAGAAEAILVRDGYAIEGSASNLFVVLDGTIITPPKDKQLLPGITRDLVLELAEQHKLPWKETTIQVSELERADEIWMTSSTREIIPITQLNGHSVGSGQPGAVWTALTRHYQDYKAAVRAGKAG
jgi:D-alanine transaminase